MTAIETDQAQEGITPDLLFRLLGTAHSVTELLDGALRDVGLSAVSFQLLSGLVNAPEPLEPHELAVATFGTATDVGQLIETLEQERLVRRTPGRIVITARGRARQHAAARLIDDVGTRLSEALAAVDVAAVGRALSALR